MKMAASWGPIAIMVVKPHNEICYNKIVNYGSYGGPYGVKAGEGDLIADPLFIDDKNGNYGLSEDSPAINAGAKTGYDHDLDGYKVPSDRLVDIGAFEF